MGSNIHIDFPGGKHVDLDPSHALDAIRHALQGALGDIQSAKHEALGAIGAEEKDALYQVNTTGNNWRGALQKEGAALKAALPSQVTDAIEEVVEDAVKAFVQAAFSGSMQIVVKTIEKSAPKGVWITIGWVQLAWNDIREHWDEIRHYVEHPPSDKSQVKSMIKAFAPDQIWLNPTVKIPVIDLGVGISPFWTADEFLAIIDEIDDAVFG